MNTTNITFNQQRTAAIVSRLEMVKLRQMQRLHPNKRAFYDRVAAYMETTGFDFDATCGLVTQERSQAYSAEHKEKTRIQYRSSTY